MYVVYEFVCMSDCDCVSVCVSVCFFPFVDIHSADCSVV